MATTIPVIIIVIATGTLTGFCHTRNTNNGPKAQAKTDQEKMPHTKVHAYDTSVMNLMAI